MWYDVCIKVGTTDVCCEVKDPDVSYKADLLEFPKARYFIIWSFTPPLENLLSRFVNLMEKMPKAGNIDDETFREIHSITAGFIACASIICYEQGSLLKRFASEFRREFVKPCSDLLPLIEYADALEAGGPMCHDTYTQAYVAYLKKSYRIRQLQKEHIEKSLLHSKLKQPFARTIDFVQSGHPVHTASNLEERNAALLSYDVVWDWWAFQLLFRQWYEEEYACIKALDPLLTGLCCLIGEAPTPPAVYPAAVDALAESDPERFKSKYRSALSNYLQMDRLASKAKAEYEIYSPKNRKTGKRHKWIVLLESDLWKEHHPDPLGSMRSKADVEQVVIERDTVNRLLAQGCRDELDRNIVALRLQDPNLDLSDIAEILGKPHDLIRQRWSRLRKRASKLFSA